MEQEQKDQQEKLVDMELIKKEIKKSLQFQCAALIKNGVLPNEAAWFQWVSEKLNIGGRTVNDEGFAHLLIGSTSGWINALGYDAIALETDNVYTIEEAVQSWASELGMPSPNCI